MEFMWTSFDRFRFSGFSAGHFEDSEIDGFKLMDLGLPFQILVVFLNVVHELVEQNCVKGIMTTTTVHG